MISIFFQYEFLQNALFTGLMIGFLGPMLGVFLVVRKLSLIADALSHITLTGIAAGLLLTKTLPAFHFLNPLHIGILFSVIGSFFVEKLRSIYKHYEELAIPITLSAGIGLGVVFISLADGFNTDLFHYLFGSVVSVTRSDLWTIAAITIIVCIVIIFFYKELFFLSFDEDHAIVAGINKKAIEFIFIVSVALVIAASMRIVGILLVSSLMTLPVASAMRLAKGFKQMFFYAILFGEISVLGGLILAYHLDIASGGMIVMMNVFILMVSIVWKKFFTKAKTPLVMKEKVKVE